MTYKEPLCFVVGMVVGGAIGVFAMRRQCDARINKEVEEARHAYNEKLSDLSKKNRNKPDASELVNSVLVDDVKTAIKNPDKKDYQAYATVTDEDPENPVITKVDAPDIFKISDENWMYDRDYDKVTAIIYADGTLARDDNDDILDIEDTIGPNGYDIALHNDDPSEAIYIRNDCSMIDYEVITSEKTYTEQTGVFLGGEARN